MSTNRYQAVNGKDALKMRWKKSVDPSQGKWPGLRKNTTEEVDGMIITWDVQVAMRDGAILYVDIFRPKDSAPTEPLPIILTYSPYGKHGPKTFDIFPNSGVPKGSVSKYAVWEGPDPLPWTKMGYAMINADARGSWACDGDCTIFSPQQAQDGYDLVEWAADLPWSNGRVGMGGVSYLAIIQWHVAALNPPHLACIVPWEGFTDPYREATHHGGIPETNFVKFTQWSCQYGRGHVEDWVSMQAEHNLLDDYHQSKQPDLSNIICPAYIVADWGDHGLHTRGTIIGYESIGSNEKWLEVHGQKKWQYYYQPSSVARQDAFYQKFLKQQPSEVYQWPRVRLEVRDQAFQGSWLSASEWPLTQTKAMLLHVNASTGNLDKEPVSQSATVQYQALQVGEGVDFVHTFERTIEIVGSMRLHLWVSASSPADDMDLFVQVDKLYPSVDGSTVAPFVAMSMIDDGPLALGWLRASHREVDETQSTVFRPYHTHLRELKMRPNDVVAVDVEIWPSSTRFRAGESIRVRLQGNDIFRYGLPQVQLHEDSVNREGGIHFIHAGGSYDSYLVVPVMDGLDLDQVNSTN